VGRGPGHVKQRLVRLLSAAVLLSTAAAGVVSASGSTPASADSPAYAIVSNGVVELGINPQGDLNVNPTPAMPSAAGTGPVGLRYVPTNDDGTAAGCTCENWGVGDARTGVWGGADTVNGNVNIAVNNFTFDPGIGSGSSATSDVIVGNSATAPVGTAASTLATTSMPVNKNHPTGPAAMPHAAVPAAATGGDIGTPTMEVTHQYMPSPITPNLYQVVVTIKNLSANPIDPLYRRAMDWDIEPTQFREFVTIDDSGTVPANLLFSSDNGFADQNVFDNPSRIEALGPPTGTTFTDSGPADHGAVFDFGFNTLNPGQSVTFTTYYGAAGTEADMLNALDAVGAQLWSLGEPSTTDGPTLGTPNTFAFAFGGVGGADLVGGDARPPVTLRVSGPSRLDSSSGAPLPNPFTITAHLTNTGTTGSTDVTTRLVPGTGLTLHSGGSGAQDLGPLAAAASTTHDWTLSVPSMCASASYTYDVFSHYAEQPTGETDRHVTGRIFVPGTCSLTGKVTNSSDGSIIGGAPVTACALVAGVPTSDCVTGVSDGATGRYTLNLPHTGTWRDSALAPAGTVFGPGALSSADVTVTPGGTTKDLQLYPPRPLPGGTTLSHLEPWTEAGLPTINWGDTQTLNGTFCHGGSVNFSIKVVDPEGQPFNGAVVTDNHGNTSFPMTESATTSGAFTGHMGPFLPGSPGYSLDGRTYHGHMLVTFRVTCPGSTTPTISTGDIYVDPSGQILDFSTHLPVTGATVTLLRKDPVTLAFVPVPSGSAIMSPTNRTNPMVTGATGGFGWDVEPGFLYAVTATAPGCTAPGHPTIPVVTSGPLPVPPPVTGLNLYLSCGGVPVVGHHADVTAEATGPHGAVVTFTPPTATPAALVTCRPASGSTFPLGTTTVSCTATLGGPTSAPSTFKVTVRDTTPPLVTVPPNFAVDATTPAGAAVTYVATASDLVDGTTTANCLPPSNSVFPVGNTTVTCRKTDAAGNVATPRSFAVHVRGAGEQLTRIAGAVTAGISDHGLQNDLGHHVSNAEAQLANGHLPALCGEMDHFVQKLQSEAGNKHPKVSSTEADVLIGAARTIEGAAGCRDMRLAAIITTIDGLHLDPGLTHDLEDRVSHANDQISHGHTDGACRALADLTRRVAQEGAKGNGRLTPAQAAVVEGAVAAAEAGIGC
jgi:hypothetical protein